MISKTLFEITIFVLILMIIAAVYLFIRFMWALNRAKSIEQDIKDRHDSSKWVKATRYNRKLYELIFEIKTKLKASNVFIARLHNGGYWNNEFPMQKFSIVTETYNPSLSKSMHDKFRDVFISKYPHAMHCLIFLGEYNVTNMEYCDDMKLKDDYKEFNIISTYMFLIKQINEERTPEAFICVSFLNQGEPRVLSPEEKDMVKGEHNNILNFLNLSK